jgi:hypothetical protein
LIAAHLGADDSLHFTAHNHINLPAGGEAQHRIEHGPRDRRPHARRAFAVGKSVSDQPPAHAGDEAARAFDLAGHILSFRAR